MTFLLRPFVLAAIVAALLGAAAWGYAQGAGSPQALGPRVLSGSDIGFEVVGQRKGKPVGRLVVRIDGKWQEVQFEQVVTPLK